MPYPRLIPCLDVADGIVVKGVRFQQLRPMGDPILLARRYSDQGADEIVFLDVKATVSARPPTLQLVAAVAQNVAIPITIGGGLRKLSDAEAFFAAGADKVALNSAAVDDPELISQIARRFGRQAVVVAIDARAGEVVTHAGTRPTRTSAVAWARAAESRGAGEILLTSMDTDGVGKGYDLALTRAVVDAVNVPVIASGGAGSAAHVAEVLRIAQAAIVATIVHESPCGLGSLRHELTERGVELRELGSVA